MEEVKVEQGTDTKEVQETGAETPAPAKKKNRWADILLIVGILMIVVAGGALLLLEWNNQRANDIYDDLKNDFVSTYPKQTTAADPGNSSGEEDTEEVTEESVEESTEESAEESTEESTEESAEESTEELTEADTEETETADSTENTEESTVETEVSTDSSATEELSTEEPEESSPETTEEQPTKEPEPPTGGVSEGEHGVDPWYQLISVDFDGLHQVNPDVVGWIHFENMDLSYPILYSEGESEYLRKNIYGQFSTVGCIYLDGENNRGFDDRRSVLYGHNRYDLSMFGKLKYYVQQRVWYPEHQYFQIFDEDGRIYRYRIFSYFWVSEKEVDLVRVDYDENDDEEFRLFINHLFNLSIYGKNDVAVEVDDKLMTLVTCFTEGNRVLVNAVRVDTYIPPTNEE